MAYGLKYELLCASKDGFLYKLRLLFDGYQGSQIDRDMPAGSDGSGPLVLRKDRSPVIKGTSLEFAIREVVDFEMDEFYTNNPKKIKVELYQASTLIWTGYVLMQQYQAEYVSAPLNIRFTATDGLGLLKNEKFTLTGRNSQLATIIYCIDKTGLSLGYSIAINLFHTSHREDRSPLEQTYEDSSCFVNLTCNEVLEEILKKYSAEITQISGKWYITRATERESSRMLYTSAGVYSGVEAAPVVLNLGYKGSSGISVWPVGRLSRTLEPGGKKVTLSLDFGRKASLLNNYDFSQFSNGQFSDWLQTGSFPLIQRVSAGKNYAFLQGYSADNSQKIYQEIPVTKVTNEDFVFELDFAPIGRHGSVFSANTILMTVRAVVALSDGVTTYFLTKEEGWTTTLTELSETVQSSISSPVWNKLKIITGELPISGTLLVSLFRFYFSGSQRPGDSHAGIAFSEPLAYLLQEGELYPSGEKTIAVFDNSTEPGDLGEISILTGDAPDLPNKSQLYKNITRLSDGTPT